MTEPIPAWQCIGCGRIEAPQTCIGVCQDRRVEFVYASDLVEAEAALATARDALQAAESARDEAQRQLDAARAERERLQALVHRLAFSRPRDGEWERSYRALQGQARDALRMREGTAGVDSPATTDAGQEGATRHAA